MPARAGLSSRTAQIVVLAAVFSVIIFLFTQGFLSQTARPTPTLKLIVQPPGYPVPGNQWSVQVWQPKTNGDYEPAKNATVTLQSNSANFTEATDTSGRLSISYQQSMGKVTMTARESGYEEATFTPVDSFVATDTAWEVMGLFFGLSVFSNGFLVRKNKNPTNPNRDMLAKITIVLDVAMTIMVVLVTIFGVLLSLIWLSDWGLGSVYGYSNQIAYGFEFDPHLIYALYLLVGGSIVLGVLHYVAPDDASEVQTAKQFGSL